MKKNGLLVVAGTFLVSLVATGCGEEPHVHSYVEHAAITATCHSEGSEAYYSCEGCDKLFNSDKEEIEQVVATQKIAHHYVDVNSVAATCEAPGNNAYSYCDGGCEKYFSADHETEINADSWVLQATGHHYVDVAAVAATCEAAGNTAYSYCDVTGCGKFFSANHEQEIAKDSWVIQPTGHAYKDVAANSATCLNAGNTAYSYCETAGCGKYFSADHAQEIAENSWVIAPLGHSYKDVAAVAATCETAGNSAYSYCEEPGCGKFFSADHAQEIAENSWVIAPTGHAYKDVAAVSATCEANGNTAYSYCENDGCGKYFDANHEAEITENSWVTNAIGHSYSLRVSGEFKTTYAAKETFDTTGLVVEKVCGNTDCEDAQTVTDYVIEYQNGSAISYGDTMVTVKVGDLSSQVTITVNKLANSITGANTSYDVHCKAGISLDGVSATNGNVSVKYYSDATHSTEVSKDNLVGNATYYAVITATATDNDYNNALAEAVVNVTHDEGSVVTPTNHFDRKTVNCNSCGGKVADDSLMTLADVNVNGENAYYGSNADIAYIEGVSKWGGDVTSDKGLVWTAWNTDAPANKDFKLPRVNYAAYGKFLFKVAQLKGSANAARYVGFGYGENRESIIPFGHHENSYIEVSYENGKLIVAGIDESITRRAIEIEDNNIATGVNPLVLNGSSQNLARVGILPIDPHEHNFEKYNRQDHIGNVKYTCTSCGLGYESEELMTTEDVLFSNTEASQYKNFSYGADLVSSENCEWPVAYPSTTYNFNGSVIGKGESSQYLRICLQPKPATDFLSYVNIALPRVDYRLYEEVEFEFNLNTTEFKVGFDAESAKSFPIDSTINSIVVKVLNLNDKVTAYILSKIDGSRVVRDITDTSVISGNASIPMYLSGKAYGNACLRVSKLDKTHEHNGTPGNIIGYKYCACGEKCGAMTTSEISVGSLTYGATVSNAEGVNCSVKNFASKINYSFDVGEFTIGLPVIDYTAYESVKFDISVGNGWWTLGFDANNKGANSTKDNAKGHILVEKQADNSYKATIYVATDAVVSNDNTTATIADADVLNGSKGLSLYAKSSNASRTMYIEGITLTAAK